MDRGSLTPDGACLATEMIGQLDVSGRSRRRKSEKSLRMNFLETDKVTAAWHVNMSDVTDKLK